MLDSFAHLFKIYFTMPSRFHQLIINKKYTFLYMKVLTPYYYLFECWTSVSFVQDTVKHLTLLWKKRVEDEKILKIMALLSILVASLVIALIGMAILLKEFLYRRKNNKTSISEQNSQHNSPHSSLPVERQTQKGI